MKLAEALLQRADIQKRLSQINTRLQSNAKVQKGERPAEDPEKLLEELDALSEQWEMLIARINLTNSATISDGKTLTELLARRECLGQKVNILRGFLSQASQTVMRSLHTEVIIRSTVDVSQLQKNVDKLSKELRELDVKIQSLNWLTELL